MTAAARTRMAALMKSASMSAIGGIDVGEADRLALAGGCRR